MAKPADGVGQAGRSAEAYALSVRQRHRPLPDADRARLPAEVRSRLMPHLGFDPDTASLHTGDEAATASRAVGAEAFTVGRHVFFGAGRFDPASERGIRLLAHELAHVGQQTRGRRAPEVAREAANASPEAPADQDVQLHRETTNAAPSTRFALPLAQPSMTTAPPPSQTATTEQGAAGTPSPAPAAGADAHLVADRVYELMKKEIALGRERGCVRIRRR